MTLTQSPNYVRKTYTKEEDIDLILEGEVGVQVGDETFVARAGDFVLKPRGVPHAFWNPTDEPARLLDVITPGGFERYFAGLGELFRSSPIPDIQALGQLAAEYGLDVDPASVPRLAQAHQLRLG